MKKDISNREHVFSLVNYFYDLGSKDEIIGPIFINAIPRESWESHMNVITDFWTSILFITNEYKGNAFPKHVPLNIEKIHFDRWLELFHVSVDALFIGTKAEEIKDRANKMGLMFQSKLQFLRDNPSMKPIV